MNTPRKISNLTEYIDYINELTETGGNYLYRGQENADWTVNSSAYRRVFKEQPDATSSFLAESFVRYLIQIVNEVQLKYPTTYKGLSPLECMAHLQHNKVATGLIDFTYSPLVALWFACDDHVEKDGKVFVLENNTEKIEEITKINILHQELDVLFDMNQLRWHLWTPALDSKVVDTQRITIQQSVFLFGLPEVTPEMNIQEIVIPYQQKELIRTELENIAISEITLFPDLLGFFERNSHQHPYDLSLNE
ncbi:FRG domain-containing protein [Candidatus Poribacteria bacterium]|nr:FRG domain-containing protein [Candidatus Poribacteria bacterium]